MLTARRQELERIGGLALAADDYLTKPFSTQELVLRVPASTDYRVSIVNAQGREAYPISSFTWILIYASQIDATKGKKLVDFLRWSLHEGEASASTLDYAPLPQNMMAQLERRLTTIKLGTLGSR